MDRFRNLILYPALVLILTYSFVKNVWEYAGYELTILTSTYFAVFNTADGTWKEIRETPEMPMHSSNTMSLSPGKSVFISWERENVLKAGIWLLKVGQFDSATNIPLFVKEPNIDFAMVSWPLGERFAIVEAGILVETVGYRWPVEQIIDAWLVNTEDNTAIPWSWDCNEIIHLLEANEFAVRCPQAEFARGKQPEMILLTLDGPQNESDWTYVSIHKRDESFVEAAWTFSPNMQMVAFSDVDTETVGYYSLKDQTSNEYRLRQHAYKLTWSPSGRYLAVFSTCGTHRGGARDACVRIYDVKEAEIVWDDKVLGDLINATSLVWTEDEREFFLLGDYQSRLGSYIWNISYGNSKIIRWNIGYYSLEIVQFLPFS